MKPEEQQVETLLRSTKPDPGVPPGLAGRIVARLDPLPASRTSPWIWRLPATAAVALLAALPFFWPAPKDERATVVEPVGTALVETPPLDVEPLDPLTRETRALERDARRAGAFLIHCLPSLPAAP